MLDSRQELPLGGAIAPEFIGYDHTGNVLQPLQQILEEALSRLRVAPTLHQNVEHGAALVDRAPQIVLFAADAEEHFIQMPFVAWPRPAPLGPVGGGWSEPQVLGADAFVADDDATLCQDRLDVAQALAEAATKPDSVGDDLGRKAEAAVQVRHLCHGQQPATSA